MNTRYRIRQLLRRGSTFLRRPIVVRQDRVVPFATHTPCENPIFVLGSKRSGTSLTRRILNAHSAIACPPETYFLTHFAAMLRDSRTMAGLDGFGIPRPHQCREIRCWAGIYHEAYRIAQNKKRWADKTPEYIDIAAEIEALFGPRAQYILVVRHPLSIAQSVAYRRLGTLQHSADPLVDAAHYVANALQRLLEHRSRYTEKCFVLYYEDLMQAPEHTLRQVFDFLGEPWEDEVLRFNAHPQGFGSEDPIVLGTRDFEPHFFDPASISASEHSALLPILQPSMQSIGYSPEHAFPFGRTGWSARP